MAANWKRNGPGDPRTDIVDVTALGNYSSVTQLTLQSDTDVTKGPLSVAQTLRHAQRLRHRFPAHCPLNRRLD